VSERDVLCTVQDKQLPRYLTVYLILLPCDAMPKHGASCWPVCVVCLHTRVLYQNS